MTRTNMLPQYTCIEPPSDRTPAPAADLDAWLAANAIQCDRLHARITAERCRTYSKANPESCFGCSQDHGKVSAGSSGHLCAVEGCMAVATQKVPGGRPVCFKHKDAPVVMPKRNLRQEMATASYNATTRRVAGIRAKKAAKESDNEHRADGSGGSVREAGERISPVPAATPAKKKSDKRGGGGFYPHISS